MGASDDIAEDAAIDEEPMSIADDDAIGCIDEARMLRRRKRPDRGSRRRDIWRCAG